MRAPLPGILSRWQKNNGGRPAIAATARPADFSARSAVPAKAAGGRVEPATLNASAKGTQGMKSAAVAPHAPATSASANHNVPKPPAYSKTPSNASFNDNSQSVTRGGANSASVRNFGNAGGNSLSPSPTAHAPGQTPPRPAYGKAPSNAPFSHGPEPNR